MFIERLIPQDHVGVAIKHCIRAPAIGRGQLELGFHTPSLNEPRTRPRLNYAAFTPSTINNAYPPTAILGSRREKKQETRTARGELEQ
jgi:hypothetical protein